MAAVVRPGGAGPGPALSGLGVPDCRKKVPSLPTASARVHPTNPASNPPFVINGTAPAPSAAARARTSAPAHDSMRTWAPVLISLVLLSLSMSPSLAISHDA